MKCRCCEAELTHTFLDLGFAPPSNAYLTLEDLSKPERYFPLRVKVCDRCWLVQTEDYAAADELFSSDYAYFSSTSTSWLEHAAHYVSKMMHQLRLNKDSLVVEIASNDGYLLKQFLHLGIPCLGIEPTASTAAAAEMLGIPVVRKFFDEQLAVEMAAQGQRADLVIGNNVYAHVPRITDFTRGVRAILKPGGTITLEFPHLMQLVGQVQFDTIYHEHFSYLSLSTVCTIFRESGLRVYNVEEITTHGGSVRIFGCHAEDGRGSSPAVEQLLAREGELGLRTIATYTQFQARANQVKDELVEFLVRIKKEGKKIAAYGAAAKGNTLLNYAGIKPDLLPFVFDAAQSKQGKFMPGSHIPIKPPSALRDLALDYILILPWNIAEEVQQQLMQHTSQGTKFVIAVPQLRIL